MTCLHRLLVEPGIAGIHVVVPVLPSYVGDSGKSSPEELTFGAHSPKGFWPRMSLACWTQPGAVLVMLLMVLLAVERAAWAVSRMGVALPDRLPARPFHRSPGGSLGKSSGGSPGGPGGPADLSSRSCPGPAAVAFPPRTAALSTGGLDQPLSWWFSGLGPGYLVPRRSSR